MRTKKSVKKSQRLTSMALNIFFAGKYVPETDNFLPITNLTYYPGKLRHVTCGANHSMFLFGKNFDASALSSCDVLCVCVLSCPEKEKNEGQK